jgi:hypothetical protein
MAGAEGQNSCTPLNNHSTNQHRPKSSHASFKASAMLKAGLAAIFWVKHFQHCRAGALKPRNTPFSAHCLQMTRGPGAPAPNHLSRQWHFKIGHSRFRKLLWLIPFMLAKKLLTCLPPVAKNSFASTVCGSQAHTPRVVCRFKKILG